MSGGHYDYAYSKMSALASEIRSDVVKYSVQRKLPYHNPWCEGSGIAEPMPGDILLHMAHIADQIERLAEAAHDIEWMMSYDYGYDTLRERCESWKLSEDARKR